MHVRVQSHIFATTEFQDNKSDTVPSEQRKISLANASEGSS